MWESFCLYFCDFLFPSINKRPCIWNTRRRRRSRKKKKQPNPLVKWKLHDRSFSVVFCSCFCQSAWITYDDYRQALVFVRITNINPFLCWHRALHRKMFRFTFIRISRSSSMALCRCSSVSISSYWSFVFVFLERCRCNGFI